jgi:AcrR family transcriptional regulator
MQKVAQARELSRRDSIIREATKLFANHGYHAVGMRSIAEAVGIQGSSLYHHFPSKPHLLAAIASEGTHAFVAATAPILEGEGAPRERLALVLREMITYYWKHRLERQVGLRDTRELEDSVPEVFALIQADLRRFQRGVENVLIEGAESGEFNCTDPKLDARAIVGMCLSINEWFREGRGVSIEDVADHYADLVVERMLAV